MWQSWQSASPCLSKAYSSASGLMGVLHESQQSLRMADGSTVGEAGARGAPACESAGRGLTEGRGFCTLWLV